MGGRGSKFSVPTNGASWSKGLGTQIADTIKDAIGLHGTEKSIAVATTSANPHFSNSYHEFSENCQRVVVAYELLRRGFDVTAHGTYRGDTLPRVAYADQSKGLYHGRWMGAFKGARPISVGAAGNNAAAEQKVIANIETQMRNFGNDSRAVVQIFYRGGGGHVFNVENQSGRVVYIEAQAGRLKDIKTTMSHVSTSTVNLVRTDNLKLSERAKNFVTTRK